LAKIPRMSLIRMLAITVASVCVFSSCNPEAPRFAFTTAERRGTLESNGLRFVIMPDPTTQLVEVDVHYDVGAREDPQGKAGLAHLVEHLMFQTRPDGPDTAPIFQTIMDLATFMNAFTQWDMTHYWTTVRQDDVDSMLKIEAMRMFYAADLPPFGCSTLKASEFEREREVVRNEIRAGSKADDYVSQLIQSTMYPANHAYARMIGGNDEQIASAQLSDACTFMKNYYTPDRATVIIAGGVDVDKTIAMIEKWFGKLPKRAPKPRLEVAAFTPDHKRHEIEADVERPALWIGWALPPGNTPDGEAVRFGLGRTIGEISRSADDYGFAYRVEPAISGGELAPLFLIRVELKSLDKVDEALEFAQKAAKQASRGWDMISAEGLQEFKNQRKAAFIAGLEPLPARSLTIGRAVQFDRDFDFNSSGLYLFHELDKIEKFDNTRVGAAVRKALDWDKVGVVLVKPSANGLKGDTRSKVKFAVAGDQAIANVAVDPREAKRPVRLRAELKGLANAKRFKLDNGMDVVMLQVKSMPLATASLIFRHVGEASTPDNPALGAAASEFLHRVGDADPNGVENTDAFSRTGIEVGCRPSLDQTVCSTHGVNIYLDIMVKGLERLVTAGEYTQSQIESWQKSVKEDWKLRSTQEENEYARQVYGTLYGPDHPYTRSAVISPDAASKIHRDSLVKYRDAHFSAANATFILVGNFELPAAEKLIRDTYGSWGKGSVDKPVDAKPYARTGPAFVGVKKGKEDQQVTLTIAYPSPAGLDGQEAARRVLAEMLNIRAESVRFKRGSTYGLYFARQAHVGPSAYMLRGGAAVGGTMDAERAGESLKAIRDSLDDLRKGDAAFDEDFVRARRKLISGLLGESTVTGELAMRLAAIAQFGLDPNYYNSLLQQIAAVSPAQIRALIATELDPRNEVVVALGDKAHLDRMFAEAGITDVKIVEPEYK
jgi:zinc protease